MGLWNTVLELVFPSKCLSCGTRGVEICEKCLSLFPGAEREVQNWIFALFDYRHPPVKKAVWFLKYKNGKRLASLFGEILYERILEELYDLKKFEDFDRPILIPIPLYSTRLKERGFNQSEILCKKIIFFDKNKYLGFEKDTLIKRKETKHQALIKNRNERLRNLAGSFGVKNVEKIKDRNLILIDDVTTTGATLNEARKILKASGAKKIFAFTIAH